MPTKPVTNFNSYLVTKDEIMPGSTINGKRVAGWSRPETGGERYEGLGFYHTDITISFTDGTKGHVLVRSEGRF